MNRRLRIWHYGAIVFCLLMALAGCAAAASPPTPSVSDIVGTWVHGSGKTRIEFRSSGEAEFISVPKQLLDGNGPTSFSPHKGPWPKLTTVSGTWQRPSRTGSAYPEMTYSIDHSGNELSIDGDNSANRTLFFLYGDDLEYRYSFTRVTTKK
jgi:hypothetical protein